MFLVTTFWSGQVIETLASNLELMVTLGWAEGDNPILQDGSGLTTMCIRRATQEEIERLT